MRKLFISAFVILLLFSCNTQKNIINVQNINNIKKLYSNNFIYTLPKTKIVVVVQIDKVIKSKGPFSDYTEKYLGELNNNIKENQTEWNISDVKYYAIPIADSANTFVISYKDNNYIPSLSLTTDGFPIAYNIEDLNYQVSDIEFDNSTINDNLSQQLSFNLVSSDKSYKVVYDTIYKQEVYDTIIRQVPILKPNLVQKTTEEQAKELADRITVLRDDKSALLVGEADNDNLPEGAALRIMLDEINILEKEYLSMFIGRTDTMTYTYSFSYTPEEKEQNSQIMLFKFSKNSGILPSDNLYGTPVYLEIDSKNNSNNINDFQSDLAIIKQANKDKTPQGLYYRIPKKATVKLLLNSQNIAEKTIFISQFGTVLSIPSNAMLNNNLKIKFYPELGSIESIKY